MSDSLLTLLEIMDQVVQEEEEAGASGGGDQAITNMTEEELKTELIDYITNLINETCDKQIEIANSRNAS